ncbi:MAG TPA: ABC transporter permease [Candidatus Dormibacteraeota bacterium]|nr:ABC transporter permease [Candidatus Dormibacteraeota bacterium]
MFLRLVGLSFLRRKRRRAVILAAVALGTCAAAALGDIALDIDDKISGELNSFGANLVVLPKGGAAQVVVGGEDVSALRAPSYLDASALGSVRDNFWKNNILAFAPILDVPARLDLAGAGGRAVLLRGTWFDREVAENGPPLRTGVRALNPYWSVAGTWPRESPAAGRTGSAPEAVAGSGLARALGLRPGGGLTIEVAGRPEHLLITGILTAGGEEDDAILVPIETAWTLSGLDGRVSRVFVRALTTPESAVYERLGTRPGEMRPEDFERWTCTPFPSSIAFELSRAVPRAEARVIRRVADSDGIILDRISGLMAIIALLAATASALAVTSALSTSVLERRAEIGLLKAMGAGNARVVGLFLAEAVVLGTAGGLLGAVAGGLMARFISASVFGAPVTIRPFALPLAVAVALVITIGGFIVPARRILTFRPAEVLRGL